METKRHMFVLWAFVKRPASTHPDNHRDHPLFAGKAKVFKARKALLKWEDNILPFPAVVIANIPAGGDIADQFPSLIANSAPSRESTNSG
ncbi:hypothetical protein DdX_08726 [Ditylenchus destructor]|uniref:Uncharacterized protein n=1 Tax=Ditylenchus destructor TaxID=166010 RepID=A0AAD4N1Y7_9BILA|nr:hypothetical protein DdX_08726 [Ditylenchus destructor]